MLIIMLLGLHYFMRYLGRQNKQEGLKGWQLKWSIMGLLGVMLIFVICISSIGVVHQISWLLTDASSVTVTYSSYAKKLK